MSRTLRTAAAAVAAVGFLAVPTTALAAPEDHPDNRGQTVSECNHNDCYPTDNRGAYVSEQAQEGDNGLASYIHSPENPSSNPGKADPKKFRSTPA